jgi:hypothetical protein
MFLPLHIARQLSALILVLSSVGLTSVLRGQLTGVENRLLFTGLLLLAAYGLLDGKLALLVVGIVLASAMLLSSLIRPQGNAEPGPDLRGTALVLAAGLILRGSYPFPDYSPIGTSPEEQVVHYLEKELPRESRILESLPLPANAARMMEVSWSSAPDEISDPSEFLEWLAEGRIRAVFVDSRDVPRPDLVALMEAGLGAQFDLGYRSDSGRHRVFLPRTEASD